MHKKTVKQQKALKRRLLIIALKREIRKLDLLLPFLCPCCGETGPTIDAIHRCEHELHKLLRQA
jgi:hypothetical protein